MIPFPFEFVVEGNAVSAQAKRRSSIRDWQGKIVHAARSQLPEGRFLSELPIAVTLLYFPATAMQGDLDNIVKPILDAMRGHIYLNDRLNDRQVERLLVQKFEPDRIFTFVSPTTTLLDALSRPKPALYVRLSDDPLEDLAA
jgi:crossover junction endodeoxyribonuclease RusA